MYNKIIVEKDMPQVIHLYLNENKTIKQISEQLNLEYMSVKWHLEKIKIRKTLEQKRQLRGWITFTFEQEQEIVKKYTELGLNLRQISEIYNCKASLILATLKKYNIKTRTIGGKMPINLDGTPYISPNKEEGHPNWKGGRIVTDDGYIKIMSSERTASGRKRYILEHRFVMEQHLGRKLDINEHVHHINGIKDDNRLENLIIKKSSNHYGEVTCPCCNHQFRIR